MEEEELILEDLIERMNNNVSVIERCNANWTSLLRDLKGEAKVTEEQEHNRVAEGDEGYVEVLLNAGECIGHMRVRMKRIEKKLVQRTPPSSPFDVKAASTSSSGLHISLPKLQLMTFDGNVLQWQEFWDTFSASVHQQGLPSVAKFIDLKSVLKGAAAAAISGIPVSNDNYDMAILLLKERFGRPQKIIESLYSQLQILPTSSNKFIDLKLTSDSVERILRQLESLSESIDQRILIQQVLGKFPLEFLIELEESKDPKVPWKTNELCKTITNTVDIQENVLHFVSNNVSY